MKRILLPILLLAAVAAAPLEISAKHDERPRREHVGYRGKDKDRKHDKDHKKDYKKDRKKDRYDGRQGNSVPRPGYGNNRRPPQHRNPPRPHRYHPGIGDMVRHASKGGRNVVVWQVGPDTYMVRYFKGGHYYMRELYASSGRYGAPFRVVRDGPGRWHRHGNRRHYYREEGSSLRVFLNGTAQNPWTLIPSVELNLSL